MDEMSDELGLLFIPYEEERVLLHKRRDALQARDRAAERQAKGSLVKLYVRFGESFKMSAEPNPKLAMTYLEKALKLQSDHPVAHYRLAHLLYRKKSFAESLVHFQRALDGSRELGLNDTQTLISHIYLVNCGLMIARESMGEVRRMQSLEEADFDEPLVDQYTDHLLLESEEMLERHVYRKVSGEQSEFISAVQYQVYREEAHPQEVLLCAGPEGYELVFRRSTVLLDLHAFYVLHVLLGSEAYRQGKDIIDALQDHPQEIEVSPENVRQIFSRLSRRVPYWEEIIETIATGNRTVRKRKDGITFTQLYHVSVVE